MRAKLILIGLVLLFGDFSRLSGQPAIDSARSEGLFGPVKTVEESVIFHSMNNGVIVPEKAKLVRRLSFDHSGNLQVLIHHRRSNSIPEFTGLRRHLVFTFDENGLPSEYRAHRSETDAKVRDHVFLRDASGTIYEYLIFEEGKQSERFTYRYNSAGELTEEMKYDPSGATLLTRTITVREPDKRKFVQTRFDADGRQLWKMVETRDAVGRVIRQEHYHGEVLAIVYEKSYDEKGRIKEVVTSRPDREPNLWVSHDVNPGKVVYKYNDTQNIVEWTDYGGDKHQYRYSTRFERRNGKGDVVEEWTITQEGRLHWVMVNLLGPGDSSIYALQGHRFIEYEYDDHGNWVKKKYFVLPPNWKGKIHYRTEERKITYH